jgi:hypothetical protein
MRSWKVLETVNHGEKNLTGFGNLSGLIINTTLLGRNLAYFLSFKAACAAAKRAIGIRNGEQLT